MEKGDKETAVSCNVGIKSSMFMVGRQLERYGHRQYTEGREQSKRAMRYVLKVLNGLEGVELEECDINIGKKSER